MSMENKTKMNGFNFKCLQNDRFLLSLSHLEPIFLALKQVSFQTGYTGRKSLRDKKNSPNTRCLLLYLIHVYMIKTWAIQQWKKRLVGVKSNNIENKFKKDSTADLAQKRKTECPKPVKPLLINHIYKQTARKTEGLAQSVWITGRNHLMDRDANLDSTLVY